MFITRVENLITTARRESENDEFTDNTGISDEDFIRWLNNAQEDLQSAIVRQHQRVFGRRVAVGGGGVPVEQAEVRLPHPMPIAPFVPNERLA